MSEPQPRYQAKAGVLKASRKDEYIGCMIMTLLIIKQSKRDNDCAMIIFNFPEYDTCTTMSEQNTDMSSFGQDACFHSFNNAVSS